LGTRDRRLRRYRPGSFRGGPSDCLDVAERDIALAALDSAHIRTVQAAFVGEGFLRNAMGLPQLADTIAKSFKDGATVHPTSLSGLYTLSPRTMSNNSACRPTMGAPLPLVRRAMPIRILSGFPSPVPPLVRDGLVKCGLAACVLPPFTSRGWKYGSFNYHVDCAALRPVRGMNGRWSGNAIEQSIGSADAGQFPIKNEDFS
jgi:hypothetical protein